MNTAVREILRTIEQAKRAREELLSLKDLVYIDDKQIKFNGNRHPCSYHVNDRPCVIISLADAFAEFVPGSTKRRGYWRNTRWNLSKDPCAVFISPGKIKWLHKKGWFLARYVQTEPYVFFNKYMSDNKGQIPDVIFNQIRQKVEKCKTKQYKESYG